MDSIKAIRNTWLKKKTTQSNDPTNEKVFIPKNKTYFVNDHSQKQTNGHNEVELAYNAGTWFIFTEHFQVSWEDHTESDQLINLIEFDKLQYVMNGSSVENLNKYLTPLNETCKRFDITTGSRIAAFLAQLAHESGSLTYSEEIASGEQYENRLDLGNTRSGDGVLFKGRGLIQLTGRANYEWVAKELDLPEIVDNPKIVAENPDLSASVAGLFWKHHNLNSLADEATIHSFRMITRRINGGLNGIDDRLAYYSRAKRVFISIEYPTYWSSIDWSDMSSKVSKFFTVREVLNGDPSRMPKTDVLKKNIFDFAQDLDKVREAWKSPIIVNSWYRDPHTNTRVGGAKNSQHLTGKAVDIRPAQGSIFSFQSWLDQGLWENKALGYGAPRGFVHIDSRSGRIRWNY